MKSYPIYLLYTMCIFTVVAHAQQCGTKDDYHTGHTYDFTSLKGVDYTYESSIGTLNMKYCVDVCGSCDTSTIPSCQKLSSPPSDGSIIKYNDDECIVMGIFDDTVTWMENYPAGATMRFSNARCKNDRIAVTRLKLTCGTGKSQIVGVNSYNRDPNNCDATVSFSTPLACAPIPSPGGGGGSGGGQQPSPIPNPTNLVGAFYQGKCGLGQIGVTMFSKASKDPATLKEIQGIMETQSTNIQNSCEKTCEMTTPNVAKFTQNSQAPLMVRNLMDSTSNGGITPASFPAIIPSKPCNCDVKLLSDVSIYCILILMIRKNKEKIRLTYISYIYTL